LSAARAATLLLVAFAALACRALPEIQGGVCGNAVVERGETCDGFGRGESSCRPPGGAHQCQLDCSVRPTGDRPACPADWGCSPDDVCRPATGRYVALADPILSNAVSLRAGDFDGDGRDDLVDVESSGTGSTFRVRFFDRKGVLEKTLSRPVGVTSLDVADVSSDGRSDLVLNVALIGVLIGQRDRTLLSQTYASYFLPKTRVRVLGTLAAEDVGDVSPLLVFADADNFALLRPDELSGGLRQVAALDGHIDDLAGEPAVGDVFEDDDRYPCLDAGFAMRGQDEVLVYSLCERDPDTRALLFREEPLLTRVRLRPSAPIDAGPLFADVDGDDHQDVLIGAGGVLYVAFGDGEQLGSARPLPPNFANSSQTLGMPLAAGDLSGDGAADLIYGNGMVFSRRGESRDQLGYDDYRGSTGSWTSALIADFNGNGLPDLVAASDQTPGIQFVNGAGGGRVNPFIIPTTRPVAHLAAGDMDGDLITDLAFAELAAPGEQADVLVAFGEPSGPPSEPIKAARASNVTQLSTVPGDPPSAVGQLLLGYEQLDADESLGGSLSWLFCDGDRNFISLVELTSFESDQSIETALALSVTTGAFRVPGRIDALSLAMRRASVRSDLTPESPAGASEVEIGVWLLPDLESRAGRPLSLGWPFDPRVSVLPGDEAHPGEGTVLQGKGDLDADGLDEVVLVASDASLEHCLVSTARVQGEDPIELVASEPVVLESGCGSEGQLEVVDVDDDGAPDIVLLTGDLLTGDASGRVLRVLWNDGMGAFSADAQTSVSDLEETPHGFTVFRPSASAPRELAYVTDTRMRLLLCPVNVTRAFTEVAVPFDFEVAGGRAIVAADVDGDGIQDLAVSGAGDVHILHAELEP
jgi:hypothetical protein